VEGDSRIFWVRTVVGVAAVVALVSAAFAGVELPEPAAAILGGLGGWLLMRRPGDLE
jgi:uncharacterized membrane protein